MAITYNGGEELLRHYANQMDTHLEEVMGFQRGLTQIKGEFAGCVKESQSGVSIQHAFTSAEEATESLRRALFEAESTMRDSGAQINDADDQVNQLVSQRAYAF